MSQWHILHLNYKKCLRLKVKVPIGVDGVNVYRKMQAFFLILTGLSIDLEDYR